MHVGENTSGFGFVFVNCTKSKAFLFCFPFFFLLFFEDRGGVGCKLDDGGVGCGLEVGKVVGKCRLRPFVFSYFFRVISLVDYVKSGEILVCLCLYVCVRACMFRKYVTNI